MLASLRMFRLYYGLTELFCGGFSLDFMLLLLEKMFQVEESCFSLLQLVEDCFMSIRVVVWCCLMFSFVAGRVTLLGFFRLVLLRFSCITLFVLRA